MTTFSPDTPDRQQIRLRLVDESVDLTRWVSYSFASSFLTPADAWSVTIADGDLADVEKDALLIGARIRLYIGDFPLMEGCIDRVEIDADRSKGTIYSLHGRDRLGAVVDSVADPRVQFKTGVTLAEFLKTLLAPYGWSGDEHFTMDAATNRDAKTGGLRGAPMSKGSKKKGPKVLKDFSLHQLKPHNHEGLFRFISRTAERFGFFVRVSADGEQIIVASPDFNQPPRYQLRRNKDGDTNVLAGSVVFDATDQPSIIIADGFSGGGEFGHGKIKSYCVNPYFGVDEEGYILDPISKILSAYPEAEPVVFVTQPFHRKANKFPPRPVFLHDEESKTQDQLNFFLRRTMSELIRKSLVCHYVVEGHGQFVDGVFTPWDVDTVVDVQDDIAGVNERMYVLGRTFDASRASGVTTKLELVRLNSIMTGEGFVSTSTAQAPAPKLTAEQREGRERPLLQEN